MVDERVDEPSHWGETTASTGPRNAGARTGVYPASLAFSLALKVPSSPTEAWDIAEDVTQQGNT